MKIKTKIKIFLIGFNIVLLFVIAIHIFSMLTFDKKLEYREETFFSENLPAEMDGYRIGFITDPHNLKAAEFERVVTELNTRKLDLLLLGGDFDMEEEELEQVFEILSGMHAVDGIYGIEGNHDNGDKLFKVMEDNGMTALENNGRYVKTGFYLAGVEDLWRRNPDVEAAVKDAEQDDFIILLAHNPDVTMHQDTSDIDLVFSGHTHGGQITVFGLWSPGLALRDKISEYGLRFMSGWCESEEGTPVYVSNGAGHGKKRPRIFARPQIIVMELKLVIDEIE